MRGVYKVSDTIATVTTAKTLLYLTADSDHVLEILSARVTCQDEDTAEQFFVELNRIATLGTPTATSRTAKPTEEGAVAWGGTAAVNVTASEPTYDDIFNAIAAHGANKLAGWEYVPLPEERPIINPSDSVGLYLVDTITSCDLTAEITFRVIGGA
jgi:hypothetical protein